MDFNWGEGNVPVVFNHSGIANRVAPSQGITVSFATLVQNSTSLSGSEGYSSGVMTATYDNQLYSIIYDYIFSWLAPATSTLSLEWVYTLGGVAQPPIDVVNNQPYTVGGFTYSGSFSVHLEAGDTIQCRAKASIGSQVFYVPQTANDLTIITSLNQTTNETILETLRGETGQWDFLKGLMTMFNLITMPDPDNPNNILIEPYGDIFLVNTAGTNLASRSIQHDWTNKVDVSEIELTPLTDLNKHTIFKYVEDDNDYAFNVYKKATSGYLYGSKEFDASAFTVLEGTDEIVAEPFAATIPKPIAPQFSNFIVPVIYSMNDDGTTQGFDNLPRIVHINDIVTGVSFYVPDQNGGTSENILEFLQCSHLSSIPIVNGTTEDLNFGECDYINPLSPTVVDNLFNTYWLPYYNELYNADTRTMTMKVNLTPADINTFKFNDKVMIKNRVFRVNRIDYKPNDLATVEFILIP
jgi:hypothetical protein